MGDAAPADAGPVDAGPFETPTPTLTETVPGSPGNTPSPVVIGTAAPSAELRLFSNGACEGEPRDVRRVAGAFGVPVEVDAGETLFSADALLPGRPRSGCSAPLAYRYEADVVVVPSRLAEPLFPPAPALTELSALTLRARVDAASGDAVRFIAPDGEVEATYDAATDAWEGRVALQEGRQVVQVAVRDEVEDTFVLTRASLPTKLVALGVDSGRGRLLLADQQLDRASERFRYRVLEVDREAGLALLRADLGFALRTLNGVAADAGGLYVSGRTPTLETAVFRDEGRGAELLSSYGERFAPDPVFLALREGELIVYATPDGVSFIDRDTGARRGVEVARVVRTCDAAYDPTRDIVLLCPKSALPEYETLVPGEAAATVMEIEAESPMLELAWDGFAERVVGRDIRYRAYELDVEAGVASPLGTMPSLRGFVVDPANGVMVGIAEVGRDERDLPLRTFDPVTVRGGELDLGAVGSGPRLSGPWGVVRLEDRVLLADANGAFDVSLGVEGGERRPMGFAGGSSWRSAALDAESARLFVMDDMGAIDRIDLASGEVTRIVSDGTGNPNHLPALDVGGDALVYVDDVFGDVLARDLLDLPAVRVLARAAPSEGPVTAAQTRAVAVAPAREEALLLQRASRLGGEVLRLVAVALDGSGSLRELRDFPGKLAGDFVEAADIAVSGGVVFVAYERTLWALDPETGAPRYERTMPGDVRELTAPGTDGVGFMTTIEGRGLLAFDGATGDWAVIAR